MKGGGVLDRKGALELDGEADAVRALLCEVTAGARQGIIAAHPEGCSLVIASHGTRRGLLVRVHRLINGLPATKLLRITCSMSDSHRTVYFNHGKESGPWGSKISKLAELARHRGFAVESLDYQELPDAGPRVERLLQSEAGKGTGHILVGSSMGGYVATVASTVLKPAGLFLMAPAFYIPGYPEQNPTPNAKRVSVVHGWSDDVIPVEHSIRFAQKFRTTTHLELHLIEDDHRLSAELPLVSLLFARFLEQIAPHDDEAQND